MQEYEVAFMDGSKTSYGCHAYSIDQTGTLTLLQQQAVMAPGQQQPNFAPVIAFASGVWRSVQPIESSKPSLLIKEGNA